MLSHQDNQLLCRVGPGTPMGALLREFWIPALPSSEFPVPDSPQLRMKLLGENLVMFRDSQGRMGALAEACPHRGASLYFGRNEECGLRCPYHGWKFDVDGKLVDLPTEEAGSTFQRYYMDKVRARAYPCRDVNHMIWVYMGPRAEPPPLPAFEVNTLAAEHVAPPSIMMEEANWVQNMEGDLDSVHLDFVHRRLNEDAPPPTVGMQGFWNPDPNPPRLDVERTSYGAYYSSMRRMRSGEDWHRVNQFIFPFHTMISAGPMVNLRSFVPLDDHHAMLIHQVADPAEPISDEGRRRAEDPFAEVGGYEERTHDPRSYFMTKANKRNDYQRDLEVERTLMSCGIPFVLNLQDRAMTELMCGPDDEPLYDRTQEHLGSSDAMVVAVRSQLLAAAKALRDDGSVPANVDDVGLDRLRAVSRLLPDDADWRTLTVQGRDADSGVGVVSEVPLILD